MFISALLLVYIAWTWPLTGCDYTTPPTISDPQLGILPSMCMYPYVDLWLNQSLTFTESIKPSCPDEPCPVDSQLNCKGRYCSEFKVTQVNCTRMNDSLDPYRFVCDNQAASYRVTGELVQCSREVPLVIYDPCVYEDSCYLTFSLTPAGDELTGGQLTFLVATILGIILCGIGLMCYSHQKCKGDVLDGIAIVEPAAEPGSPEPLVVNPDGRLAPLSYITSDSLYMGPFTVNIARPPAKVEIAEAP